MGVLATLNLDYDAAVSKQIADLSAYLTASAPDVLLVQGADEINLRSVIPGTYLTNQVLRDKNTRGCAIVWKNTQSLVETGPVYSSEPGYLDTPSKYLSIAVLSLSGRQTKYASLYFDEQQGRQARQIANVLSIAQNSSVPNIAIGGKFNFPVSTDMYGVTKKTSMVAKYDLETGFYLTPSVSGGSITVGTRTLSDEVPLSVTMTM